MYNKTCEILSSEHSFNRFHHHGPQLPTYTGSLGSNKLVRGSRVLGVEPCRHQFTSFVGVTLEGDERVPRVDVPDWQLDPPRVVNFKRLLGVLSPKAINITKSTEYYTSR